MRVIFSHIPKNAGTSIVSSLKLKPYRIRPPQEEFVTLKHRPWREVKLPGFKFTFIRNPYSRAVSLYFYYFGRGRIAETDFLSFCRNLGKYDYLMDVPQSYWLEGADWDFIGSVESIESDFERLLNILELPKCKLKHRNRSRHRFWKKYYCAESYEIITEYFKSDFELGYKKCH